MSQEVHGGHFFPHCNALRVENFIVTPSSNLDCLFTVLKVYGYPEVNSS